MTVQYKMQLKIYTQQLVKITNQVQHLTTFAFFLKIAFFD